MSERWPRFEVSVSGKWVLAGEHAVLKGAVAVALPHPGVGLRLSFVPGGETLDIQPQSIRTLVLELLGEAVPAGKLCVESSIPIGAGLGSSAALCVALTRWLGISEDRWVEFATQLEHRFHGRSSGMDVAAVVAGEPVSFIRGKGATPLGLKRLPRFTFHDTGMRCRTDECITRVEKLRTERPEWSNKVDESMGQASILAIEGLRQYDQGHVSEGLKLLAEAMGQARECFYHWGLVPEEARKLEESLLREGALAVKLTGAGGGGMVIALWSDL